MPTEQWRPCVGWPDYEVSDLGRVKSIGRWRPHNRYKGKLMWWKEKILKPGKKTNRGDYLFVVLTGQVAVTVHLLVAEAFIGPRPPGMYVRHLNDIPGDNRPANISYGTQQDNMDDAARNGKIPRGRARPNAKLHEVNIPYIRTSGKNLTELGKQYGVSPATIRDVLVGISWSHVP